MQCVSLLLRRYNERKVQEAEFLYYPSKLGGSLCHHLLRAPDQGRLLLRLGPELARKENPGT